MHLKNRIVQNSIEIPETFKIHRKLFEPSYLNGILNREPMDF